MWWWCRFLHTFCPQGPLMKIGRNLHYSATHQHQFCVNIFSSRVARFSSLGTKDAWLTHCSISCWSLRSISASWSRSAVIFFDPRSSLSRNASEDIKKINKFKVKSSLTDLVSSHDCSILITPRKFRPKVFFLQRISSRVFLFFHFSNLQGKSRKNASDKIMFVR